MKLTHEGIAIVEGDNYLSKDIEAAVSDRRRWRQTSGSGTRFLAGAKLKRLRSTPLTEECSMRIGIIGNGVLGGCLSRWLGDKAKAFDKEPSRSPNSFGDVIESHLIFICIWLQNNAETQAEYLILEDYVRLMRPGTIAVIRSTVVPGTCAKLQALFPDIKICYCPEFLTEKNAWGDFQHPWIQVVGGPIDAASEVISLLPMAPKRALVTTTQAEWIKHATAGFLSTKVSWFNQLYDALGEDFEPVAEVMRQDPRIGASHSYVLADGYRGWGGKCFTKDTPCFAKASGMPIMLEVVDYNRELMKEKP